MSNKLSGAKVKLFIKDATTGTVLAGQRSATLNRDAETIDVTSKDTEGGFTESVQGMKSWSIEADGAYVESDTAYDSLEDAYLAGTEVDCYIEFPSGKKYAGLAIVTSFPLEIPFDDLVSYSLSLQGTGPLTKTTGV
jgi:TP901-1 family phage major tail protein